VSSRYTTFTAPLHDKFLRPTAESSTSEPKGQELVYAARISLDCTQMQVEDNLVNLSPGMAVTVEVKTGSRAVLT
jgi:hemolysin D